MAKADIPNNGRRIAYGSIAGGVTGAAVTCILIYAGAMLVSRGAVGENVMGELAKGACFSGAAIGAAACAGKIPCGKIVAGFLSGAVFSAVVFLLAWTQSEGGGEAAMAVRIGICGISGGVFGGVLRMKRREQRKVSRKKRSRR